MTISYTETFRLTDPGAIADLSMSNRMDDVLRNALDDHTDRLDIKEEIEERITEKLRAYGVTEDGEWLGGQWSAEQVVRDVLAAHGVDTTEVP